jgi:predicted RNA polymerase sigma factor
VLVGANRLQYTNTARTVRLVDGKPCCAAHAGLLARADVTAEALSAYNLAIGLECGPALREFLQHKHRELSSASG